MPTGYEIEKLSVAKKQVVATMQLAVAIRDLTNLLKNETIKRRGRV